MAVSSFLAATFAFALLLPIFYCSLALLWRGIKPSFDSFYKLMANAAALAACLRLLSIIFHDLLSPGEHVRGLTGQDMFYLLIGAAAAGWYGVAGIFKTFNKLFKVELEEEPEEN